jgi:hypothetical protein
VLTDLQLHILHTRMQSLKLEKFVLILMNTFTKVVWILVSVNLQLGSLLIIRYLSGRTDC